MGTLLREVNSCLFCTADTPIKGKEIFTWSCCLDRLDRFFPGFLEVLFLKMPKSKRNRAGKNILNVFRV